MSINRNGSQRDKSVGNTTGWNDEANAVLEEDGIDKVNPQRPLPANLFMRPSVATSTSRKDLSKILSQPSRSPPPASHVKPMVSRNEKKRTWRMSLLIILAFEEKIVFCGTARGGN